MKNIDSEILCPFYIREGACTVTCEGIIPGTVVTHIFKSKTLKHRFERGLCCTYQENKCPHAGTLRKKYDDGEFGDA